MSKVFRFLGYAVVWLLGSAGVLLTLAVALVSWLASIALPVAIVGLIVWLILGRPELAWR